MTNQPGPFLTLKPLYWVFQEYYNAWVILQCWTDAMLPTFSLCIEECLHSRFESCLTYPDNRQSRRPRGSISRHETCMHIWQFCAPTAQHLAKRGAWSTEHQPWLHISWIHGHCPVQQVDIQLQETEAQHFMHVMVRSVEVKKKDELVLSFLGLWSIRTLAQMRQ